MSDAPDRRGPIRSWEGRFLEDFVVGDVYRHAHGRTISEADNTWFTLLTSRTLPPLVCMDEPELGLHPRALPIVAGACKVASARSRAQTSAASCRLNAASRSKTGRGGEIAPMLLYDGKRVT